MNKFESRQSSPNLGMNEGWFVQVYGSNRRLLCVLDSSHGWLFLIGCGFGLLISVIWINAASYSPAPETSLPAESSFLQLD